MQHFAKHVRLVAGGASRQETVARCLDQAPPETDVVVVHDAVRPFVELAMIRQIVDAARKDGAVILGIPSVDTVKKVERYHHRNHSARAHCPGADAAGFPLYDSAPGV